LYEKTHSTIKAVCCISQITLLRVQASVGLIVAVVKEMHSHVEVLSLLKAIIYTCKVQEVALVFFQQGHTKL
jgi:hypothetical protein